jgi:hypothetical protein
MGEGIQAGWTRVLTRTGRYEYQFQGAVPSVRSGAYLEAHDYQFLVMDEEGWLYKIPVRLADEALAKSEGTGAAAKSAQQIAEGQLRAGLEKFRPKQNVPYEELDGFFAVDAERARELAGGSS